MAARFASIDQKYGLPVGSLQSVWIEESSGGRNTGYSSAGARGHFQFMPDTAAEIKAKSGHDPFSNNPEEAAHAAGYYLRELRGQFNGNMTLALAAYNAGPGKVRAAIRKYGDDWLKGLPGETQKYVPAVMGRFGAELYSAMDYNSRYEDGLVDDADDKTKRRRMRLRALGMSEEEVATMTKEQLLGMEFILALFGVLAKSVEQENQEKIAQLVPAGLPSAPLVVSNDKPNGVAPKTPFTVVANLQPSVGLPLV